MACKGSGVQIPSAPRYLNQQVRGVVVVKTLSMPKPLLIFVVKKIIGTK